ncbi:MAG TPA: hypothetical protein VM925_13555, partial [Labilithrix sp.]|nr:hypothetical protein [Labilithrix sp.]
MRQGRARIALLGFACACGSDRENPSVVRDTSGATFAWRCNEDGCTAEPQGPLPDATCGDFYGNSHGRFVEICVARRNKIGWSTTPDQCRLVVCQADTD